MLTEVQASTQLGITYSILGSYEKAKTLFEQSYIIYKKQFGETHPNCLGNLVYLGNIYGYLGDYKKATYYLHKALIIHENNYGKNNVKTVQILRDLGQVHLLNGEIEIAENLVSMALRILQKDAHPESYLCLEILSDLYHQKSLQAKNGENIQQFRLYKKQALTYLTQALKILKSHFPGDSPHIVRIETKFKNREKEVL